MKQAQKIFTSNIKGMIACRIDDSFKGSKTYRANQNSPYNGTFFGSVNRACNIYNYDPNVLREQLQQYSVYNDKQFLECQKLPEYFEMER